MKKLLMILLLIVVGSIKCTSIAQEVNNDDKQRIIDYINCFYTARYVLNDAIIANAEKQAIKNAGIDTVSIGYACKYAELDSILRNSNLNKTADNLTTKLNERNEEIVHSYNGNIFDFVDNVVDMKDFKNFKFARQDECEIRNSILKWFFERNGDNMCQKSNELEHDDKAQYSEKGKGIPWKWIIGAFIVFLIIVFTILWYKDRGYEDNEDKHSYLYQISNSTIPQENQRLRFEFEKQRKEIEKLKGILKEREERVDTNVQGEINNGVEKNDIGNPIDTKVDMEKPIISTAIYYADVDVDNNLFVRTYERYIKKSIYVIDANQHSFTLIDDEQLYEDNLSRANSSGILGACEVNGSYKKGKTVSITPGKVQQEENGKWRIINKAKIEIK